MLEIYCDEMLRGQNLVTDRVYDDGDLRVDSGYTSLGSSPAISFYYVRPDVLIVGGNPEKQNWGSDRATRPRYAWDLLLSKLNGPTLLAAMERYAAAKVSEALGKYRDAMVARLREDA